MRSVEHRPYYTKIYRKLGGMEEGDCSCDLNDLCGELFGKDCGFDIDGSGLIGGNNPNLGSFIQKVLRLKSSFKIDESSNNLRGIIQNYSGLVKSLRETSTSDLNKFEVSSYLRTKVSPEEINKMMPPEGTVNKYDFWINKAKSFKKSDVRHIYCHQQALVSCPSENGDEKSLLQEKVQLLLEPVLSRDERKIQSAVENFDVEKYSDLCNQALRYKNKEILKEAIDQSIGRITTLRENIAENQKKIFNLISLELSDEQKLALTPESQTAEDWLNAKKDLSDPLEIAFCYFMAVEADPNIARGEDEDVYTAGHNAHKSLNSASGECITRLLGEQARYQATLSLEVFNKTFDKLRQIDKVCEVKTVKVDNALLSPQLHLGIERLQSQKKNSFFNPNAEHKQHLELLAALNQIHKISKPLEHEQFELEIESIIKKECQKLVDLYSGNPSEDQGKFIDRQIGKIFDTPAMGFMSDYASYTIDMNNIKNEIGSLKIEEINLSNVKDIIKKHAKSTREKFSFSKRKKEIKNQRNEDAYQFMAMSQVIFEKWKNEFDEALKSRDEFFSRLSAEHSGLDSIALMSSSHDEIEKKIINLNLGDPKTENLKKELTAVTARYTKARETLNKVRMYKLVSLAPSDKNNRLTNKYYQKGVEALINQIKLKTQLVSFFKIGDAATEEYNNTLLHREVLGSEFCQNIDIAYKHSVRKYDAAKRVGDKDIAVSLEPALSDLSNIKLVLIGKDSRAYKNEINKIIGDFSDSSDIAILKNLITKMEKEADITLAEIGTKASKINNKDCRKALLKIAHDAIKRELKDYSKDFLVGALLSGNYDQIGGRFQNIGFRRDTKQIFVFDCGHRKKLSKYKGLKDFCSKKSGSVMIDLFLESAHSSPEKSQDLFNALYSYEKKALDWGRKIVDKDKELENTSSLKNPALVGIGGVILLISYAVRAAIRVIVSLINKLFNRDRANKYQKPYQLFNNFIGLVKRTFIYSAHNYDSSMDTSKDLDISIDKKEFSDLILENKKVFIKHYLKEYVLGSDANTAQDNLVNLLEGLKGSKYRAAKEGGPDLKSIMVLIEETITSSDEFLGLYKNEDIKKLLEQLEAGPVLMPEVIVPAVVNISEPSSAHPKVSEDVSRITLKSSCSREQPEKKLIEDFINSLNKPSDASYRSEKVDTSESNWNIIRDTDSSSIAKVKIETVDSEKHVEITDISPDITQKESGAILESLEDINISGHIETFEDLKVLGVILLAAHDKAPECEITFEPKLLEQLKSEEKVDEMEALPGIDLVREQADKVGFVNVPSASNKM